jgi:glycosyltransferase involved in cell wall biosynthesis
MTACLFGTYDRGHSANRLLRRALAGAGFEVEELHEPVWESTREKAARYFGAPSLAQLAVRWAGAARRLVRAWRRDRPPPLVVVGFGGQLDVLLAARFCRPRAGLVFAPLVTLSETLVEDRQVFPAGGSRARLAAALDRASLRAADLVLADTAAHADYMQGLGVERERLAVWHFGVEPEFVTPPARAPVPGRVLFYGRYLPLHGIDTIVRAAAILGARADVVLIGGGPERRGLQSRADRLGARITWRDELPLAGLRDQLAEASVALGIFGTGRKAAMVVPNKVYQAAAAGRPLVTRDGPALREVLEPGEHCVVCPPGDPVALAAAVGELLAAPSLAERFGAAARAHVLARFGAEQVAARLADVLAARLGVRANAPAPGMATGA